jgi:hypothetical protein
MTPPKIKQDNVPIWHSDRYEAPINSLDVPIQPFDEESLNREARKALKSTKLEKS